MSKPARILIFSATTGYRHESIPMSIEILKSKAAEINVEFDATEDGSWFTDDRLQQYDAILFLNNSGDDILTPEGKAAFQKYLDLGGNFIGIHCAAACLYDSEFYQKELGALFDYHPEISPGIVEVIDEHPTTKFLPKKWQVFDEMYNFRSDPRSVGAKVILIADETSYKDDGERKYDHGAPHPIAWYQERGAGVQPGGTAGRSWYTGLGHGDETWKDDLFIQHVLAGIQWALASGTTKVSDSAAQLGSA